MYNAVRITKRESVGGSAMLGVALMNNKGEKAVPFPFFERKEGA